MAFLFLFIRNIQSTYAAEGCFIINRNTVICRYNFLIRFLTTMITLLIFITARILTNPYSISICSQLPAAIVVSGRRDRLFHAACISFAILGQCCCIKDLSGIFTVRLFSFYCYFCRLYYYFLTVFTTELTISNDLTVFFIPIHSDILEFMDFR